MVVTECNAYRFDTLIINYRREIRVLKGLPDTRHELLTIKCNSKVKYIINRVPLRLLGLLREDNTSVFAPPFRRLVDLDR